jgi:hypothetical protein
MIYFYLRRIEKTNYSKIRRHSSGMLFFKAFDLVSFSHSRLGFARSVIGSFSKAEDICQVSISRKAK